MIFKEEVLLIHSQVITIHGGANGLRDAGQLDAAIARPFQTFGGKELYPTVFEKAAAIGESLIMNHPFIDGNKRTGYVLMETILRMNGIKITARDESLYVFVVSISTGEIRYDQIVDWLKNNTAAL
jgi:death-on-curing protein